MSDVFELEVEFVGADEPFTAPHRTTRVTVVAGSVCAAELTALEMVAADGRKPVRVNVNWEAF